MPKILFIGDTHCRVRFIHDYRVLHKNLITIAEKVAPDLIVFAGDDAHDHATIHAYQLQAVCELLSEMAKHAPVVKLIGNHERVSPNSFLGNDHHFHGLAQNPGIHIVDKPFKMRVGGDTIGFFPYVPPGRFFEMEETSDLTQYSLCFSHQEFRGVVVGNQKSTVDDVWLSEYPLMVAGHIHQQTQVSENLIYPGAPAQFNFGDSEHKYVAVIEGNAIEYIPTEGVTYKTHQLDAAQDLPDSLEFSTLDRNRVVIEGTLDQLKAFRTSRLYKQLQKNSFVITPKPILAGSTTSMTQAEKRTFEMIMSELLTDDLKGVWDEIRA